MEVVEVVEDKGAGLPEASLGGNGLKVVKNTKSKGPVIFGNVELEIKPSFLIRRSIEAAPPLYFPARFHANIAGRYRPPWALSDKRYNWVASQCRCAMFILFSGPASR